jgi:hypothetical protein
MLTLIKKLGSLVQTVWQQRHFYLAKLWTQPAPPAPMHNLPEGFTVNTIGETGIRVVDNFLSADEANYLIQLAKNESLDHSQVVYHGEAVVDETRSSSHHIVYHRYKQEPRVMSFVARGAMLAGVPTDHAEQVYVCRYVGGDFYHGHYDFSPGFLTEDRLCTVLIYLNDVEPGHGGETFFRELNIAVRPVTGRAVFWTNTNPDGSNHYEAMHAALPPIDAEKWVVQLWFRPYKMFSTQHELPALQTRAGVALTGREKLIDGVEPANPATEHAAEAAETES